jgi:hypothetical protein
VQPRCYPSGTPASTSRRCAARSLSWLRWRADMLPSTTAAGSMSSCGRVPSESVSSRRLPLTSSTTDTRHTEVGPRSTTSVPSTVGSHSVSTYTSPSYITRVPTPMRTPAHVMQQLASSEPTATTALSTDPCSLRGSTTCAATLHGQAVLHHLSCVRHRRTSRSRTAHNPQRTHSRLID